MSPLFESIETLEAVEALVEAALTATGLEEAKAGLGVVKAGQETGCSGWGRT